MTASTVSAAALPGALRTLLNESSSLAAHAQPIAVHGRLLRAAGLVLEASGLRLPVGAICRVESGMDGEQAVEAEVVGFGADRLFLMPTGQVTGLSPGARVTPIDAPVRAPMLGQPSHPWRRSTDRMRHLPIGAGVLGRVVDACGTPIGRGPPLGEVRNEPIQSRPISAMDREPVRIPLDTGVRAINAMLPVGRGQSVLLGMMARFTAADVIVVGLIGERGREVKEFIEHILGEEGRRRSVVVAAPADCPPLLRLQGANYATAIAEHFRDQGLHVLLLMDSLTRYAMAAREVALAIGEPPATKGYPPSVFAKLPLLVERAGNGRDGHGSITAFYTVLAEGDDQNDPIADAARSFLDGHFVLTRALAESGHYPAIDIEQSISRVMHNVASDGHIALARRAKALWSRYQRSRDLISVGAYVPGNDPETDQSIALFPRIARMLQQSMTECSPLGESLRNLDLALGPGQA